MIDFQLTNHFKRIQSLRSVIKQLNMYGGKPYEVRESEEGYSVWVELPVLGEYYKDAKTQKDF